MDIFGVSQQDLSDRTELKPAAVSHFLCGRRIPSFNNLQKLIAAFPDEMDLRWFIMGYRK